MLIKQSKSIITYLTIKKIDNIANKIPTSSLNSSFSAKNKYARITVTAG